MMVIGEEPKFAVEEMLKNQMDSTTMAQSDYIAVNAERHGPKRWANP